MPGAYDQKSIQLHFSQTNKRLADIEAQLARLSKEAGIDYDEPTSEVPEDVIELAQAGKVLEAAKRYRELTGASGDEAMALVQGL